MTSRWKLLGCLTLVSLLAPASSRTAEPPSRLPNQIYNRMVCVRTGGDRDGFVDMPGHFDLGSPSVSPDSKWIAFDALTIGESPQRETWLVGIDGRGLRKLTSKRPTVVAGWQAALDQSRKREPFVATDQDLRRRDFDGQR